MSYYDQKRHDEACGLEFKAPDMNFFSSGLASCPWHKPAEPPWAGKPVRCALFDKELRQEGGGDVSYHQGIKLVSVPAIYRCEECLAMSDAEWEAETKKRKEPTT